MVYSVFYVSPAPSYFFESVPVAYFRNMGSLHSLLNCNSITHSMPTIFQSERNHTCKDVARHVSKAYKSCRFDSKRANHCILITQRADSICESGQLSSTPRDGNTAKYNFDSLETSRRGAWRESGGI